MRKAHTQNKHWQTNWQCAVCVPHACLRLRWQRRPHARNVIQKLYHRHLLGICAICECMERAWRFAHMQNAHTIRMFCPSHIHTSQALRQANIIISASIHPNLRRGCQLHVCHHAVRCAHPSTPSHTQMQTDNASLLPAIAISLIHPHRNTNCARAQHPWTSVFTRQQQQRLTSVQISRSQVSDRYVLLYRFYFPNDVQFAKITIFFIFNTIVNWNAAFSSHNITDSSDLNNILRDTEVRPNNGPVCEIVCTVPSMYVWHKDNYRSISLAQSKWNTGGRVPSPSSSRKCVENTNRK